MISPQRIIPIQSMTVTSLFFSPHTIYILQIIISEKRSRQCQDEKARCQEIGKIAPAHKKRRAGKRGCAFPVCRFDLWNMFQSFVTGT